MHSSLIRRASRNIVILALVALVLGVISFSNGTADADIPPNPAGFDAENSFATDLTASLAGVDTTNTLDLITPTDINFSATVAFFPEGATIAPGWGNGDDGIGNTDPDLGDIVGTLVSKTTLGLTNAACVPAGDLTFRFLNATTDINHTIDPMDPLLAPDEGVLFNMKFDNDSDGVVEDDAPGAGAFPDEDVNELPNHVDHYPSYLNTLFNDTQPYARYSSRINVLGTEVVLQFLLFAPGTYGAIFSAPHPAADLSASSLGWASVTVLQDTTQPASPSAVTDFCSPLESTTDLLGESQDNHCLPGGVDIACLTDAQLNFPPDGADTGRIRYTNPAAGQEYFYAFNQSIRDVDGDGLENSLDACPYTPSGVAEGFNPRVSGTGGIGGATHDPDFDGIPDHCDPTPTVNTGANNHDGDGIGLLLNNKEWQNLGDGCPLIGSGGATGTTNAETENSETDLVARPRGGSLTDGIPDDCDVAESGAECDPGNVADDEAPIVDQATGPDGLINDGCPAVGAPEIGCLNDADDDNDGTVNDGCPSSASVANGPTHTVVNKIAICYGGGDTDGDGWCDSTETANGSCASDPCGAEFTESHPDPDGVGPLLACTAPNCAFYSTPENYAVHDIFPIAHSGSGPPPLNTAPSAQEPAQVCWDGIDNDLDGEIDLLELDGTDADTPSRLDCAPSIAQLTSVDSDGDGYNDATEVFVGTDTLGRCEVGGSTTTHVPSGDWPIDLTGKAPPTTADKSNIADLFQLNGMNGSGPSQTPLGKAVYDKRYDVAPGPASFANTSSKWIDLADFFSMVFNFPAMNPVGIRAFNGPLCTAHPTFND